MAPELKREYHEVSDEKGRLLLNQGRICVPLPLRIEVMEKFHSSPHAGHMGQWKMLELITRHYWWKTIVRDVKKFVMACKNCQRNKNYMHPLEGPLRGAEVSEVPWQDISMDLIIKLPRSHIKTLTAPSVGSQNEKGVDSIWVVVDRFTSK